MNIKKLNNFLKLINDYKKEINNIRSYNELNDSI